MVMVCLKVLKIIVTLATFIYDYVKINAKISAFTNSQEVFLCRKTFRVMSDGKHRVSF